MYSSDHYLYAPLFPDNHLLNNYLLFTAAHKDLSCRHNLLRTSLEIHLQ